MSEILWQRCILTLWSPSTHKLQFLDACYLQLLLFLRCISEASNVLQCVSDIEGGDDDRLAFDQLCTHHARLIYGIDVAQMKDRTGGGGGGGGGCGRHDRGDDKTH